MIEINDSLNLLKPDDLKALETQSTKWSFDVRVFVKEASSKSEFEAEIAKEVTTPNTVAVGIDPTHHHVVVRYGNASGVPSQDWPSIGSSGNQDFKAGRWADGLTKIANKAQASKVQSHVAVEAVPAQEHSNTPLWVGGGVFAVVACVLTLMYWRNSKKKRQEQIALNRYFQRIRDEVAAQKKAELKRKVSERPGTIYRNPEQVQATVKSTSDYRREGFTFENKNSSNNDVINAQTVVVVHTSAAAAPVRSSSSSSYTSSSYDSGGSSSSYDSGSSFDSGGSSSSW